MSSAINIILKSKRDFIKEMPWEPTHITMNSDVLELIKEEAANCSVIDEEALYYNNHPRVMGLLIEIDNKRYRSGEFNLMASWL